MSSAMRRRLRLGRMRTGDETQPIVSRPRRSPEQYVVVPALAGQRAVVLGEALQRL